MNHPSELLRSDLVSKLRDLETTLRANGVRHLAVFGSRARGDEQPDSDLDVLIDIESSSKFSLLDLVGISHVIEDALGISANVFTRRSLDPQFSASIRADLVEIF